MNFFERHYAIWTFRNGKGPQPIDRTGRWRGGRDTETDIMAVNTGGPDKIRFGECKFHLHTPMQAAERDQPREKALGSKDPKAFSVKKE